METIIIEKHCKNDYKNDKELKGFNFVIKAINKKDNKELLKKVFIDEGLAVCTDGSRLHLFATDLEIESGLYDVVSAKTSQVVLRKSKLDLQFPDYKKVIPIPKFEKTVFCNGSDHRLFHTIYRDFASDYESYNPNFIHDLYIEKSEMQIYKDMEKRFSPLVVYDGDSRAAVVMPIKNKD
jgi:hypothetical protein